MTLSLSNKSIGSLGGVEVNRAKKQIRSLLQIQARRFAISMGLHKRFYSHLLGRTFGLMDAPAAVGKATEGAVFVLPGIEAESAYTYCMRDGLRAAGVRGLMSIFDWALPFPLGYFSNLARLDRNRKRGVDLAEQIVRYQDAYPGKPVHVVAHSGGAGVAVFALEALPRGRMVDGLALLAGALSPRYDLTRALARSRKGILNSFSAKDWVVGMGTRLFGTTDRKFCAACGSVGFTRPDKTAEDGALYEKLTQVAWTPEMESDCIHWGTHATSAKEEYVSRHIAPWIAS